MKATLPAQLYGKAAGRERAPFEVLAAAEEMTAWEAHITRAIAFQWQGEGESPYPAVWYLYPLPEAPGTALLCRFEDVGADPRPHTLRRTVALCTPEHRPLLEAIRRGRVKDVSPSLEQDGNWVLEYEDAAPSTLDWKPQYLQAGTAGSHELQTDGKPLPRQGSSPAPPSSPTRDTTLPRHTSPSLPSSRTQHPLMPHLAWGCLCALLAGCCLCLILANNSLRQSHRELTARTAQAEARCQEAILSRRQWNSSLQRLHDQQKTLELMQQSMSDFQQQIALIRQQNEELSNLIKQQATLQPPPPPPVTGAEAETSATPPQRESPRNKIPDLIRNILPR